jgi:transposase InsO family protein
VGIKPLVGTVGDSYDNVLAETINGLYKTELVHYLVPMEEYTSTRTGNAKLGALVQS